MLNMPLIKCKKGFQFYLKLLLPAAALSTAKLAIKLAANIRNQISRYISS